MPAIARQAPFERWIGDRSVPSLGTNDGAPPIAFQKWHHFKEAFAPELIAKAIAANPIPVQACYDPFGGSGTTALTAQMLGIASETVEVNPFLVDVIRAKVHQYDTDSLVEHLGAIRRISRSTTTDRPSALGALPPSFVEPGNGERWIFSARVAERISRVLGAIRESCEDAAERRLFEVLLGGTLIEVSNVIVSGKGRRYRTNWEISQAAGSDVDLAFADRAATAIRDIRAFADRSLAEARVVHGDARTAEPAGNFELAVFSPPYPNSFDYTDVYNVQLWVLGYLSDSKSNRALRQSTLSSHVQIARSYPAAPNGSKTLDDTLSRLDAGRAGLWSQWIPGMVGGYFADLCTVIEATLRHIRPGGQCWLVVGDSRYAGIRVPVAQILEELARDRGWLPRRVEAIRHMKSSAQQGWKADLDESLLVLESS